MIYNSNITWKLSRNKSLTSKTFIKVKEKRFWKMLKKQMFMDGSLNKTSVL